MSGQVADVALRGRTPGARRRPGPRRRGLLRFGHRRLEVLERQLQLPGIELLGLLPVHRPAQLPHQVFETPVQVFEMLVALGEGRDLGARRLKRRLLSLEQRPQGRREGGEIGLAEVHVHEQNSIIISAT